MARARIGVDLGGTKIEAVALADDGRELARRRVPTPQGDYDGTVRAIAALVATIATDVECELSFGVGIPGTISPATGLIKNANSTCLIGHRLDHDLTAATGRAVRLANDANCFALSEAVDGAARDYPSVLGIILGTGCGSGLVVDRRPVVGGNAIAGEWGHNPLPWPEADERPGRLCYCGKYGCNETFLSGPGLAADHREHTGEILSAVEIASRAAAGERNATATLDRYVERLAKALASVLNLFDPHIVVVGGGLSHIAAIYDEVPRRWGRYVFSDIVTTPIARARHGDSSGVRGAARLWPG